MAPVMGRERDQASVRAVSVVTGRVADQAWVPVASGEAGWAVARAWVPAASGEAAPADQLEVDQLGELLGKAHLCLA